MKKIGVIGTGIQGTAIIKKLIIAGYEIWMYDQISSKMSKAITFGAIPCQSAAELIQVADVILLVLPAGPSPMNLISRKDCRESLKSGKLILQLGSTSVEATKRMEDLVTSSGAQFAECVLCGPIAMVMDGTCPLLFGGDPDIEKLIKSLCENFGKIIPIGEVGQASAFNLGALSHVYSIVHGFALGTAMVERSGIDTDKWLDFIKSGIGGHPADFLVEFLYPAHFENRSYGLVGPAQVKNDGAQQESRLILDRAKTLNLDTALLNSIHTLHQTAYEKANEADWSSFYDHIAPVTPTFDEPSFLPSTLKGESAPELAKQASFNLQKLGVSEKLTTNKKEKSRILVGDAIQKENTVAYPDQSLKEVGNLLATSKFSDIPVVDRESGAFLGIASEGDLLRAVLPDFAEVIAIDPTLLRASVIFQENAKRISNQPVGSIIISDPITLSPDQDILLATTMMVEKMIRRLPVTENGIYLGSLSRADIVHFLMTL